MSVTPLDDPVRAADRLIAEGRCNEAVGLLEPLIARGETSLGVLSALGRAFQAAGRAQDALAAYRRAVLVSPESGVAEHNVASVLGDLAQHADAEAAAKGALAKGLDAPETWLVLARALQGQARFKEAEVAYRECLRRRPNEAAAHRDYAQMLWMQTGDLRNAAHALDAAMSAYPAQGSLAIVKSNLLQVTGDDQGAYAALTAAVGKNPLDTTLLSTAAIAACRAGFAQAALVLAERALAVNPGEPNLQLARAQARLAVGDATGAATDALEVRSRRPQDQFVIAVLATAWRLLDDARYHELYDYSAFVLSLSLATPHGWPHLAAYLADLAKALIETHNYRNHPFDQSLRGGSQAPDLLNSKHPAIQALPEALNEPLHQALTQLGSGNDPVRARNTRSCGFAGIWSVRLNPGGRHVNHVHPAGWLSSACYVEVPEVGDQDGKEGWIKFGEPGIPTLPVLEAEHFEQPAPGKLLIFPSYMWHGTVPLWNGRHRLTFAFDLRPT